MDKREYGILAWNGGAVWKPVSETLRLTKAEALILVDEMSRFAPGYYQMFRFVCDECCQCFLVGNEINASDKKIENIRKHCEKNGRIH